MTRWVSLLRKTHFTHTQFCTTVHQKCHQMVSLATCTALVILPEIGNIAIGGFFALTATDILPLNLTSVSLIFGSGLLLGTLTAFVLYLFVIKSFNYSL